MPVLKVPSAVQCDVVPQGAGQCVHARLLLIAVAPWVEVQEEAAAAGAVAAAGEAASVVAAVGSA